MSHEQSETIQGKDGKWYNVYGRKTPKAGKVLPGEPAYGSVDEAVSAAKKRSAAAGVHEHEPSIRTLPKPPAPVMPPKHVKIKLPKPVKPPTITPGVRG